MKSKGKILRIKTGYNPNSSSIGTHINNFLLGSAAVALFFGSMVVYIQALKQKKQSSLEAEQDVK